MTTGDLMDTTEEYKTQSNNRIHVHEGQVMEYGQYRPTKPSITSKREIPSLVIPLQILFCLNGATLALPGLALMQILNDRAKVPLELMSVYGALAFLPFSLKPFYSMMELYWNNKSQHTFAVFKRHHPRSVLIAILLLLSSVSIGLTARVPEDGVAWCIIIGFVRGIMIAFPEFLLGLTLLDDARAVSTKSGVREDECDLYSFERVSGVYQAQAATARNVGSFLSSLGLFCFLAVRRFCMLDGGNSARLGDGTSSGILIFTSIFPVVGAWITLRYKVGMSVSRNNPRRSTGIKRNTNGYTAIADGSSADARVEEIVYKQAPASSPGTTFSMEVVFIVAFQILLIWIGVKRLIAPSYPQLWNTTTLFTILVMVTCILARTFYFQQRPKIIQYGPAFFLTLKQAMPQHAYQLYSFKYFLFGGFPIYLQLLSLIDSAMSTVGSGTYARYIATLKNTSLSNIILVTTLVSALVSLSSLILAVRWDDDPKEHILRNFLIAIPVSALSTFFYEISFLPSVVLATASVRFEESEGESTDESSDCDDNDVCSLENQVVSQETVSFGGQNVSLSKDAFLEVGNENSYDMGYGTVSDNTKDSREIFSSITDDIDAAPLSPESTYKEVKEYNSSCNEGMQYGTYVACIDFGDQIGAWIAVPIVSALGVSRHDWSRLPELILICSGFSLVPLLFLFLLGKDKKK